MRHFHFENDELYCEDVKLQDVATDLGTPVYVYSQNTLLDNLAEIESALAGIDHTVCYALKANSNEKLLSLLAGQGAGADVVSAGEIYLALKSGFPPEKIVFAGVGKRDDEILFALNRDILAFNVESAEELQAINDLAGEENKRARIGIRINPDIDIQGHPYIATGKSENKFGISVSDVPQFLQHLSGLANVELVGLHCHTGSQIRAVSPYLAAIKALSQLKNRVEKEGSTLRYIDIGGGLGVNYEAPFDKPSLTATELFSEIRADLSALNCRIIFEPGRSLIANVGVLLTQVLYGKQTRGKRFVVVDAGMTELIRPSLYNAYHEIVPLKTAPGQPEVKVDVVGPICESGDFLAKDRIMPEVSRGDLLAVLTVGAYGFSLSSNYNARPRPAEVLVNGGRYQVIRERGKIEELWR